MKKYFHRTGYRLIMILLIALVLTLLLRQLASVMQVLPGTD